MNISTVVALVTAPVHKGVINDAGIAVPIDELTGIGPGYHTVFQ